MQYIKKVLMLRRTEILEQNVKPLSVLARIEIESGVGEFYISVINLPTHIKSEGYYALVIDGEGKEFEFDLGIRPTSLSKTFYQVPNVEKGVAIGFYSISEQIPITLAFINQEKGISLAEFKKLVADKCLLRFKQNIKEKQCLFENQNNFSKNQTEENKDVLSMYNDEAVATENYYEIDEEIKQKLRSIREKGSEDLFFENEHFDSTDEKTEKEERLFNNSVENEKSACQCQEIESIDCDFNQTENYYDGVKQELEQIFYTYPAEESLEKIFKGSKWAKIFYSKDKFYVVGLIFEEEKEKYICYGVPSKYTATPPKELEGYSSFIPLSVFDMFGDGYFIMFQDAKSGRCVHFN